MSSPGSGDDAARSASWHAAWRAIGIDRSDPALRSALLARWSEPHRAYHTLQHLDECLALFDALRGEAERPAEIALALWFHDAIYDVHAHDNEARSADWARAAMLEAGADPDAAARVHALVMATRHDALPEGTDARLLIDIDLSILGAPVERFAEYERQIRIEYAHVPREVFEPRRRAILGSFLARDPLYLTNAMLSAREAAARRNLRAAIT